MIGFNLALVTFEQTDSARIADKHAGGGDTGRARGQSVKRGNDIVARRRAELNTQAKSNAAQPSNSWSDLDRQHVPSAVQRLRVLETLQKQ